VAFDEEFQYHTAAFNRRVHRPSACAGSGQAAGDTQPAQVARAGGAGKMSYGIPTLALGKNVFHFAAFKAHIGLYPGAAAIEVFAAALAKYKTSKGAIQIPLDQEIPLGKLCINRPQPCLRAPRWAATI
jgi:hypothetical protein